MKVALLTLLSAGLCSGHGSIHVVLEGEKNTIKITHSAHSEHTPDVVECTDEVQARVGIDPAGQHHFNLEYRIGGEGQKCVVALFGDDKHHPGTRSEWLEDKTPWYLPKAIFGEDPHQHEHNGTFIKHGPFYTAHIHPGATDLHLTAVNRTILTPLHYASREGTVLQNIPGVTGGVFSSVQSIGEPESTQNLVFLAAGYLESEKGTFDSDVQSAIQFLQFDAAEFPIARYYPAMNVFSVFQPSVEAGASKPAQSLKRNNNLDCTYGAGSSSEPARILQCSRAKTVALADTSPATASHTNTVVIVLVNDVDYGGSGLYTVSLRMATLYAAGLRGTANAARGRSLFFHELGHALVDLSDEYTVDATESGRNCAPPFSDKYDTKLPLCEKNCAASLTDLGWQGLIDAGKVPKQPGAGCYFKNFYKPGQLDGTPCLMEKVSGTKLCPVCRQATALQIYSNGLNLTSPTCPRADQTVTYLTLAGDNSSSATFFINERLFYILHNRDQRHFGVTWRLDDTEITVRHGSYLVVNAVSNSLDIGRHVLSVTIEDKTDFVLPQYRTAAMNNVTVNWQIEVVSAFSDVVSAIGSNFHTCSSSGPFHQQLQPAQYRYYAQCTGKNNTCDFNYTTTPYENPKDLNETVKAIEDWIFGLGGALVGAGILAFGIVYFCMIILSEDPKRCMEDTMTKPIRYITRILITSNIIFMIAAIGICVFMAILYQKVGAVAKLGLIAGMVLAGALFLIGWVGGTSSYSRKVVPLIFNICLVILIVIAIFVVTVVLYYVGYGSDNNGSTVQNQLRDRWTDTVKSDPGLICTAQKQFECSGWDVACDRVFSPSNCPRDCDLTNALYSRTCKVEVITFLHQWLPVVASVCLFLVYFLLSGLILCIVLVHILRKSASIEEHKSKLLQDGPIEGLLGIARLHHGDKKQLRRDLEKEFRKFDKSGTGRLDKIEFSRLFESTIGVTLSQEQLDLLFALLDVTGTGLVSVSDWLEVLTKTTTLSKDEVIDFLSERKERAALIEDRRRAERLGLLDEEPTCPLALDDESENYDQAFSVYGRIDNDSFFGMRNEFMKLIKVDEAETPYVSIEEYKEHVKEMFKLNMKSRRSRTVVEGLPQLMEDTKDEPNGRLTWTDWCATYFIRRDCYMELLSKKGWLHKKKVGDIKKDAEKAGFVSFTAQKTARSPDDPESPTQQLHTGYTDVTMQEHAYNPTGREGYGIA